MNLLPADRVEALFRLFDSGLSDRAAAREAGISREAVGRYRRIWRAGRRDRIVDTVVLRLPPAAGRALAEEARRRGLSPSALATLALTSIAEEAYWSAVLDD